MSAVQTVLDFWLGKFGKNACGGFVFHFFHFNVMCTIYYLPNMTMDTYSKSPKVGNSSTLFVR